MKAKTIYFLEEKDIHIQKIIFQEDAKSTNRKRKKS